MTKKDQHLPAAPKGKKDTPKLSPLQKAQARFNKLVKEIAAAEEENKTQTAQNDRYHQLYQQKVLPLLRQYAAEKIALIRQFDNILARYKFSKAQQRRYTQWAVETLMEVAPYSEEAAALLDVRREELFNFLSNRQKEQFTRIKEDKTGSFEGDEDDWSDIFEEDPFANFGNAHQQQRPAPKGETASPQIDDIGPLYKELAKKLHPDLEQNEKEKARKHELMQQLTEARKQRDLYTMLRIKAKLEEAEATPANWGLEQLKRYNKLLEGKLQQLREKFSNVLVGSMMQRGLSVLGGSDPEVEINKEVRNLKKTIRNIREDRPLIHTREHLEQLLDSLRWEDY